jgi:dihydrodipicolinate synthase/N-acetylneuraminate lyase
MKELYPLFGIITVLSTPFTNSYQVDYADLKRNVESAINAGVSGILVPAMASEVYKLSRRERQKMVTAVLEQTGKRVPVIGGAGEPDNQKRKQIVTDLIKLECKKILLQIPFKNLKQYQKEVTEIANMDVDMIMLQDWDSRGFGLPLEVIIKLFTEIDKFRCLKIEVVPAGLKYSQVLEATSGQLNVSGGWAVSQMMEALERGVHAFMPTGMYEIYTTIYSLYKKGQIESARMLFQEILPVLSFSNQHLDISVHFFKRLLFRQGIYTTPFVRDPILPFDDVHQKIADRLIDHIFRLSEKIKYFKPNQ